MSVPPKAFEPYAPLNTLKPAAEDLWIVDGPEIGMKTLGLSVPFPTRMTVVRLPGGGLWLHSPIAWSEPLAKALDALGQVRCLVAPNTLHYWHLPVWQAHYPEARSYVAPGLLQRARRPLSPDEILGAQAPGPWAGALDQLVVPSRLFTEVVFFHRASRSLILTDLIENFEPWRVHSRILRALMRLGGVAAPDGKAPVDMQLSFLGRKRQLHDVVERMLDWKPERIFLAHGRWYETDAVAELRRAFRWVLR